MLDIITKLLHTTIIIMWDPMMLSYGTLTKNYILRNIRKGGKNGERPTPGVIACSQTA